MQEQGLEKFNIFYMKVRLCIGDVAREFITGDSLKSLRFLLFRPQDWDQQKRSPSLKSYHVISKTLGHSSKRLLLVTNSMSGAVPSSEVKFWRLRRRLTSGKILNRLRGS